MTHTVLIALHAAGGVVALVAGCFAIRRSALFPLYFGALTVSVGSFVVAVIEEWGRIDAVSKVVFSGLTVLAFVMLARADRARRLDGRGAGRSRIPLRTRLGGRTRRRDAPVESAQERTDAALVRYRDIVFTLISLFAAYVVIQVRGLDAPLWAVLGSVAISSLAGHITARRFEPRGLRPLEAARRRATGIA